MYFPHSDQFIGYQFILHSFLTSNGWSSLGVIKMVCCNSTVTWGQRHVEAQTSQSDATRSIEECSCRFLHRPKTLKLQTVGKVCLDHSANLLEALWSFFSTSWSCSKNQLKGTGVYQSSFRVLLECAYPVLDPHIIKLITRLRLSSGGLLMGPCTDTTEHRA